MLYEFYATVAILNSIMLELLDPVPFAHRNSQKESEILLKVGVIGLGHMEQLHLLNAFPINDVKLV